MKSLNAIILAAGLSTRMGEFKPLLTVGSETLVERLIHVFSQNQVPVTLVTGWKQADLRAAIKNPEVTLVENPDYRQGMFSSIQKGVGSLPADCSGFFIMPVDTPLIRPYTVRRLQDSWEHNPDKIIYPVINHQRGHPTLIPGSLRTTILDGQPDGGLQTILKSRESMALEVSVPDRNILFDVDTPEDYRQLLKRLSNSEIPTPEECQIILQDIHIMPEDRYLHCRQVARVALTIGEALTRKNIKVDLSLLEAAAILHDIAKGQPKHALTGGKILAEMGFGKTSEIVAAHTNLAQGKMEHSLESRIVYLADKMVKGTDLVSLEKRFEYANSLFGVNPEVAANIQLNKQRAVKVKNDIENILEYPLESILTDANTE